MKTSGRRLLRSASETVQATWNALQAHVPELPFPAGLDHRSLRLPQMEMPVDPRALLMPLDLLPDSRSLVGLTLERTPYLEFARRFLAEEPFDPSTSAFHQLAPGLLERTGPGLLWGPDQDCAEFIFLIKEMQLEWMADHELDPVVLAEYRDGRHVVLAGLRVLAAAAAIGRATFPVQVMPDNEVRAGVLQNLHRLRPRRLFRRSLAFAQDLGRDPERYDRQAIEIAQEIAAHPLVRSGDTYQPIPFPEFGKLKCQTDEMASYQKLGVILSLCRDFSGLHCLDLGCNLGFYVFSLARRGALVTGIDRDSRFIDIARRIADIKCVECEFLAGSLAPELFDAEGPLVAGRPRWDLVVCFSTLQWVVKEHGEAYAVDFLKSLRPHAKALLIDIPVNCGGERLHAPPGMEICRIADFVRGSCGYPHNRYIGVVAPYQIDRRHLFYCSEE